MSIKAEVTCFKKKDKNKKNQCSFALECNNCKVCSSESNQSAGQAMNFSVKITMHSTRDFYRGGGCGGKKKKKNQFLTIAPGSIE